MHSHDVNFKETSEASNYIYHPISPAMVEGLHENTWHRLPPQVVTQVNREVFTELAAYTSGGVFRFSAEAGTVAIRAELSNPNMHMPHMPLTGSSGIDILVAGKYRSTLQAKLGEPLLKGEITLDKTSEITLYLPLFNGIESLEIGLLPHKTLLPATAYSDPKPLLFYGSSITQGGCASRPSNAYTALVSAWLGRPFRCLGFSGNAKGDLPVAEYIAKETMSAFVYDYDHNTFSHTHLKETHLPFLLTILKEQPKLPVLMLSKPDLHPWNQQVQEDLRRTVIQESYEFCKKEGYHVSFVDGASLFEEEARQYCTVDATHPNDLGFYQMAKRIYPVLKEMYQTR